MTFIELGNKRKMFEGELMDNIMGKLIYLSHACRDIAFAVRLISQYMHSLCQGHLNVVHIILRYLNQTPRRGLFFFWQKLTIDV